jgi:cysteine-rich repeat protein
MLRLHRALLAMLAVIAFLAIVAGASLAHAEPLRLSTSGRATLGTPAFEFERDAVVELETTTGTATLYFDEGNFANSENIDAIHVLGNGHLVLSTAAEATLGHPPLTFADGDLVEYDRAADTATIFLPETVFAGNVDIDAVHVRADGTILLSTDDTATLGTPPLTFLDGDVVHYDPGTKVATRIFSEADFAGDEDIDALHELANGHLVLSVERATGAALAGIVFGDGDLVEYRPSDGTATLFFAEATFPDDENIDALDLGCGNGLLEADEECDAGGESPSCNADCTLGTCGDGTTNGAAGETCDDGNLIDGDGCDSNCTPTGCGNGVVTAPEACDDGGESATCDTDCTTALCGDGTTNGAAGETCDDGDLTDGDGCDSNCTPTGCGNSVVTAPEACDDGGESATCDTDCTTALCGDGTTNASASEVCDDGNLVDGDCCTATCTTEAAFSPCPDDGDACTTVSECDGAGTCVHRAEPATGCFLPAVADKALLQIKDKAPDAKDTLTWKWLKGEVTTVADFGDPIGGDDYTLCIYDVSGATPSVIVRAAAPAGGVCGTGNKLKDCWKPTKKGFKYVDKALTPDGLLKVDLKEGVEPGKAKVLVTGKGDNLPMPALPLPLPLRAQLHAGNGTCWEATYSATGLKKNTPAEFKAKAD